MNFNLFYILGFCNYCIEFLFFPVHTQYCCRGTVIWNMFNFSFCTTVFYKKRGKTNKKSWFPEKQLIKKKKKKKKKKNRKKQSIKMRFMEFMKNNIYLFGK